MKKAVILLVIALVAGSMAPVAEAAKKKKKKPVPVDQVYSIVWSDEACALSVTKDLADPAQACSDVFWGATGSTLGAGPAIIPALDGLPLTLDATKPIIGQLTVESWHFAGLGPDVMGIGQAELAVTLAGTSAGEDIVLGEIVTDAYTVTPASDTYEVTFEIQPAAELQGKVLDSLTMTLEAQGMQMFHGVVPADGNSTVTIGAFKAK